MGAAVLVPCGVAGGVLTRHGIPVDQGETGLIANRVIAPNLGDVDLVLRDQSPGDVDSGGRHVQMERRAHTPEVGPLRHGFEVVDRLPGFDLHHPFQSFAAIRRRQDEVRKHLTGSNLDARRLFVADVGGDVVLTLEAGLQQPDDPVVLELLADGAYQRSDSRNLRVTLNAN